MSRKLILLIWEYDMHFIWFSRRDGVFSDELTVSSPSPVAARVGNDGVIGLCCAHYLG